MKSPVCGAFDSASWTRPSAALWQTAVDAWRCRFVAFLKLVESALVRLYISIQHPCACAAQAEAGANGCAHSVMHSQAGSVGGASPAFILAGEVCIPALCLPEV